MKPSFSFLCLTLLVLLLAGCTGLPLRMAASEPEPVVRRLSTMAEPVVFAMAPDRQSLALSDQGLQLLTLATGIRSSVDPRTPGALAWSPDGAVLAAYFPAASGEGTIEWFGSDGSKKAAVAVTGNVHALLWHSDAELLAVVNSSATHRFGVSMQQRLLVFRQGEIIRQSPLHDTTVIPYYSRKFGIKTLQGKIEPRLSPLGDELLYSKLFNPPMFTPYLMLTVRNLASGVEFPVARVELAAPDARFSADGESVFWMDADGNVWQRRLWNNTLDEQLLKDAVQRKHVRMLAGTVYREGGAAVAVPDDALLAEVGGNSVLVGWRGSLYRLELADSDVPAFPSLTGSQRERLIALRSWRASGLIADAEYQESKQRIVTP